jgi:hypothetical protein
LPSHCFQLNLQANDLQNYKLAIPYVKQTTHQPQKKRTNRNHKRKEQTAQLVDGCVLFGIGDHNNSMPRREDHKMEESYRMEERVAALESAVNFLVFQIIETIEAIP